MGWIGGAGASRYISSIFVLFSKKHSISTQVRKSQISIADRQMGERGNEN